MAETAERIDEIRKKRIATLLGCYEFFKTRYLEVRENTHISKSLVACTVEDYIRDRQALVNRHGIKGRIQRHKIAGLMAAAIVKNRPVQLIQDSDVNHLSMDNEYLAALHGLAVCSEGREPGEIAKIISNPAIRIWFNDFVYYLRRQPSNTEGFIAVFLTLSATYFPENLNHLIESNGEAKVEGVIEIPVKAA